MLFDYNAIGIATICDATKVCVWRVVCKDHVWAVLLETILAFGAVTVGVNQTADCSNVAGLELGNCGTHLGDTANDLMSGNARINCGHRTPLVTDLVEVRVADSAKEDFDLNVVFARITPGDCRGRKWRFRTRSRVSLRFILTM
jgi:hypothetical protein